MSTPGSQNQDDADEPPSQPPDGITRAAPSVADIQKYLAQTQEKGTKLPVAFNETIDIKEIDRISQGRNPSYQEQSQPSSSNSNPPVQSAPTSVDADSQWPPRSEFQQQMWNNYDTNQKTPGEQPSVATNTTVGGAGQRSRANSTQTSQAGGDARSRANSMGEAGTSGFGAQASPSQIFGEGYTAGENRLSQSQDLPPNYAEGLQGQQPMFPNSKAYKEWILKFELFTIKFLNKIFWRARTARRLIEAVKYKSCRNKKPAGFVPTANTGVYPYSTFVPLEGFEESKVDSTLVNNEEEEAAVASELNAMLEEIGQVIAKIDQSYLPLVTPIFQTHLMDLKNKDFRETDNREIYRRIDDYAAVIRCDAHICLESVQSRLGILNNFLNAIQKETETLRRFPRILTKCYSTESKICQDVCEVYSDDEFQTVNIKKMCKLKCKKPERPPWRLTYKIGQECFPGYDAKMEAQTAPCPPVKQCCTSGPTCGTGASCGKTGPSCCGTGPNTCTTAPSCGAEPTCCGGAAGGTCTKGPSCCGRSNNCGGGNNCADNRPYKAELNKCGDRIIVRGNSCKCGCGPKCNAKKPIGCGRRRRKYCNRTSKRRRDCPCGCVDSVDKIPNICGILFTRFRALDIENTPMMVEGHSTEVNFPSTTDFKSIRELEIPSQKLFTCDPKCDNPIPCHARDHCFGTGGWSKWKNKQFPCGAKNNCKRETSCKPRRDPRSCCMPGRTRKKKRHSECGTSMTNLPGIGILRVPEGLGHQEFKEIMTDFYGTLTGRGGNNLVGSGAYKDGYNMSGIVTTQTTQQQLNPPPPSPLPPPPVDREKLEQELKAKQLQDKGDFEERLRKQREEFAEKQRMLWNGFEEHEATLPFDQVQEHRLGFDQEMSNQRQKFEESILYQWKEFNAKQDQEQKDLETKVANANAAIAAAAASLPLQNQQDSVNTNWHWQVQDRSPDPQTGRYNFMQMSVQVPGNIEQGFRNIEMNKEACVQQEQQTQAGFIGRIQPGGPVYSTKQQQTFKPYEQFQPVTGDELQAELEKCLQVPSNTLTGCLAKLAMTAGDGPTDFNTTKQKEEVYLGFISQMLAAGNISKEDADKMTNLVKSKLQMERMENSRNQCTTRGGRRSQKEAQCCLANTCPTTRPNYVQDNKFMHVCQDGDSCPHGTLRGYSTPAKVFTQTKTYTTNSRCDLHHTKGWQNPDGSYDTGALCMSTAKRDNCPNTCPIPKRPPNCIKPLGKCKSHSDVMKKPAAPLCAVKSYPMVMKPPQCFQQKYDFMTPPCCDFSLPKIPFSSKKDKCGPATTINIAPVAAAKLSIPEVPPPPPPFRDPTPPPSMSSNRTSPPNASEKSLSLASLSPSPPTSAHEVEATEENGPKRQSKKKNYKSPFKFRKVAPPPDCETSFSKLPECHPLKTPYPPQYRFDEVRLRRYQEQCGLLKQICSRTPGEQCWTPPPPPLPPDPRDRQPFPPPDPCAPNLFPQAGLGMGCGYGLSSGSCYGPFGLKKRQPKPEECFFDCGGICPMTCPEPEIPVVKKKKKKCDEFFCFDYITVMREKNPKKQEQSYCDLYKQQREMQRQPRCEAELPTLEIEVETPRGRRRRGRERDDNCNLPPLPNDEITRFLLRPDVHIVKEQKTEIIKKHDCEGQPEKMVSQFEAYYTKNNDGRISTEFKDLTRDPNANNPVDEWIKQDGETTLRKLNRARNCGDDCPMRDTDWEKEFKEFAKSCQRPKKKPKGPNLKPLPAGFLPCPLPDAPAPIMCRVEDPKNLSGGSVAPTIQCQAIPFPLRNLVGNTLTPDGRCPLTLTVPPFGMPTPPGAYGGYVMQEPFPQQIILPPLPVPAERESSNVDGSWSNSAPRQNGSMKFAPTQPVNSVLRGSTQKSALKKKERKSDDYPYMCEIKYHEPIQGSIYGRVVSRKQPCRLIDPDTGLPPDHNPECPVIMETPFFNPSCPLKGKSETKTEQNNQNTPN